MTTILNEKQVGRVRIAINGAMERKRMAEYPEVTTENGGLENRYKYIAEPLRRVSRLLNKDGLNIKEVVSVIEGFKRMDPMAFDYGEAANWNSLKDSIEVNYQIMDLPKIR